MQALHADFEDILASLTQEVPPKILAAYVDYSKGGVEELEELMRVMAEHRKENGDFSLPFIAQILKPDLQENLERLNSILDGVDRSDQELSELELSGPGNDPEPEDEETPVARAPTGIFDFFLTGL